MPFLECDGGILGQVLAEMSLHFSVNMIWTLPSYVGMAMTVLAIYLAKPKVLQHISQFPLAIYTLCASHCLNLAVVSSLEEVNVRNMIGVVNRVSIFFSTHPKQHYKLEEAIEITEPESSVRKVKDLCRTRWIEWSDLNSFISQLLHAWRAY